MYTYLIDTAIGSPTITNVNLSIDNLTLRLLQQKGIEVIHDGIKIGTWLI